MLRLATLLHVKNFHHMYISRFGAVRILNSANTINGLPLEVAIWNSSIFAMTTHFEIIIAAIFNKVRIV